MRLELTRRAAAVAVFPSPPVRHGGILREQCDRAGSAMARGTQTGSGLLMRGQAGPAQTGRTNRFEIPYWRSAWTVTHEWRCSR